MSEMVDARVTGYSFVITFGLTWPDGPRVLTGNVGEWHAALQREFKPAIVTLVEGPRPGGQVAVGLKIDPELEKMAGEEMYVRAGRALAPFYQKVTVVPC